MQIEQKSKNKKKHKVCFSREDRLLLLEETIDDKAEKKGDTESKMDSVMMMLNMMMIKLTNLNFKQSVVNWWENVVYPTHFSSVPTPL